MFRGLRLPPRAYDEFSEESALVRLRGILVHLMRQGVEDPERFMVYLVTELAVAPHSRRYANMPEISDAYRPIIRDLVGSNRHSFECLAKS